MCGHQYPPRVISAWDHGASSLADGSSIARTSDDGSHQGGRARGSCGKGNRGESRRHVVTQDQPTVRSGWGQQARGQVWVRRTHPAQRRRQRRRGETSPARVRTRNVGPPVSLPAGRGRDSGPRGPPQGLPVWESGASAGGSVMEPRGIARLSERLTRDILLRARVQTSAWSVRTRTCADEASTGVRGEGSRRNGGREPASPVALAPDQRAASPSDRASGAAPSRAGRAGGHAAHGPCRATPAHPLVERPCRGRHARDDQPGHPHAGGGSRPVGHAGEARARRG
jgi:hypothetical protein